MLPLAELGDDVLLHTHVQPDAAGQHCEDSEIDHAAVGQHDDVRMTPEEDKQDVGHREEKSEHVLDLPGGLSHFEHFRPLQLSRDLDEILTSGRECRDVKDPFLKAGMIMQKTVGILRTGSSAVHTRTAIVGVLMSEYPYIERGELFQLLSDGRESVNDDYLLFLINLVIERLGGND